LNDVTSSETAVGEYDGYLIGKLGSSRCDVVQSGDMSECDDKETQTQEKSQT
jgi:hypothetical protein